MAEVQERIAEFLAGTTYAVVGASADRAKYGNKVLRAYLQSGREAYPVNLRGGTIEGRQACARLAELPGPVHGVSIVVPPGQTERVVAEAARLGIERVWMQPGAESAEAVAACREAGIRCIHGGPCVLVALGFSERGQ